MANVHGTPGEWARVKGTTLSLSPLFTGLLVAGFFAGLTLRWQAVGMVGFVVSSLFCAWMLYRGMRRIECFFKGARGEERVAGILAELPETYHVFNDYVACGSHIDHVVVGPAGVFAVETKLWQGRVTIEEGRVLIDGELPDRSPLAQVLHEAELVRQQLEKDGWKTAVTPILAFASDTFNSQPAELQGAIIINSSELKNTFAVSATILSRAEVDRLVHLMM